MISRTVKGLVTKASALAGKEGLLLHPSFSKPLRGSLGWLLHGYRGEIKQNRFWFGKVKHKICKALVWASNELRLERVYVCASSLTQQKAQDALHDQNSTYAIPEAQLSPAVLNYPSRKKAVRDKNKQTFSHATEEAVCQ